jgi:hypothetical protein
LNLNKIANLSYSLLLSLILNGDWGWGLGIGDWGLGIGDWAQSPIPNPQSPIPIPNPHLKHLSIKFYHKINKQK